MLLFTTADARNEPIFAFSYAKTEEIGTFVEIPNNRSKTKRSQVEPGIDRRSSGEIAIVLCIFKDQDVLCVCVLRSSTPELHRREAEADGEENGNKQSEGTEGEGVQGTTIK